MFYPDMVICCIPLIGSRCDRDYLRVMDVRGRSGAGWVTKVERQSLGSNRPAWRRAPCEGGFRHVKSTDWGAISPSVSAPSGIGRDRWTLLPSAEVSQAWAPRAFARVRETGRKASAGDQS